MRPGEGGSLEAHRVLDLLDALDAVNHDGSIAGGVREPGHLPRAVRTQARIATDSR